MVEVPDILGKSASEAEATLKNKKLNIQLDSSNNSGVVVSQDPPSGTMVEEDSAVRVTIKSEIAGG